MKILVAIVGESGCGKSTTISRLSELHSFYPIDSYTTRPMRKENEKGHIFVRKEDYEFVTEISENTNKQELVIKKNGKPIDYIAYTYFDGHHYWAQKNQILDIKGTSFALYTVDPRGLEELKNRLKDSDIKLFSIYLSLPHDERLERMRQRGDTFYSAVERISHDKQVFREVRTDVTLNISGMTASEVTLILYRLITDFAQSQMRLGDGKYEERY